MQVKWLTILIVLFSAFFTGCSDSGSIVKSDTEINDETIKMTQDNEYSEKSGESMQLYRHTADNDYIDFGSIVDREFIVDNVLHSEQQGDIHFSVYIPDSYDGRSPYALFVTLPGWEGLYFQGVGANLAEDFPFEAIDYNDKMIVISPQLDDWGETSADMTITLTEYFLKNYNIDTEKVYLHGMSGGGETGSIVMGKSPGLYTAYLETSSQWDGDLQTLAAAKIPVYLVIGENDSYYGADPMINAYNELYDIYKAQGLTDEEINSILVLVVREAEYFSERGYSDQHAGGQAFAHDPKIMGWLFGEH